MAAGNKQKLLVVLGPTATGKTALAIRLARRWGGEIISADSMQIYRGLDVGTAKATPQEQALAPHHLIDIRDPEELFSVAEFTALARQAVAEIAARGNLPILTGGTGLYISSLREGLAFSDEPPDNGTRARLAREAAELGAAAMHTRLAGVDPETAAAIHPNNVKRVLRALELYEKTGRTMSGQRAASRPPEPPYDALVLGLDFADRETLYARIGLRIGRMLDEGLLEEARRVYEHRQSWRTAAQAIGYKELFPFFEGEASLEDCADRLRQATRNYAKRQLTWFKRMPGVCWLDAARPCLPPEAEAFLRAAGREASSKF